MTDFWDDPFHAMAFSAFISEARAIGGWPSPDNVKRRAYALFSEQAVPEPAADKPVGE